jgi:hypothetical protein
MAHVQSRFAFTARIVHIPGAVVYLPVFAAGVDCPVRF